MSSKVWIVILTFPFVSLAADDDWGNLDRLRAGTRIHVVQIDKKTVDGQFVHSTPEVLTVRADQTEVNLEKGRVVRISRNSTGHRVRNMVLLGVAGAVAGAGATLFGVACAETDNGCFNAKIAPVVGGAAGAGLGAVLPASTVVYRVKKLPKP